jgi:AcrR family transcriptional regulator
MSPTAPRPRRKRDPVSTRIAILEAAQTILARDGAEAMSVSRVANLAGVNRGTAYQHFQVKEELIAATLEWVSQQLLEAVFEQPDVEGEDAGEHLDPDQEHLPEVIRAMGRFTIRLAEYAVENPDIGRIWLYDVLAKKNPKEDVFFKRFEQAIEDLAASDASEDGVDSEALAVLMLTGYFMWPVWVRAHAGSKKQRREMARRFSREVLRLSMHGVLHADTHLEMENFLQEQD